MKAEIKNSTKMESKMTPMADPATNDRPGDLPMEGALCVLKFKSGIDKNKDLFVMGSLVFAPVGLKQKFYIKRYGKADEFYPAEQFTHFQPVANENGGFYFIK